ncbi:MULTISPECIES: hypothetical protein [unclassified Leuconostoc]|uniref:hypothetical protein n=1 Tax=unclassified Leuconostoc TaxID=2685106 RepID=UPI001906A6C3|nr:MULTISPECIES: hypothetical protein [unclassified Leuconostoc]MBK0041522.1 hypothetical protein [Leuconostoc sp. S51]MBK0052473.1 hypothetical protein [Leuconostoc sp. S50]
MTVKISVKEELGISKLFEVKESNKNIRKTWKFQKDMVSVEIDSTKREKAQKEKEAARKIAIDAGEEVESSDDDDDIEAYEQSIDKMLAIQDKMIAYISDMLNLPDKLSEKLDDLDYEKTQELAMRISSEILHIKTEKASEEETGLEA